jgi:uncharacterized protein YecE (DUF72 family)
VGLSEHLLNVEDEVDLFLNNMEPLQEKTLALLIQLPPSMEIMHGLDRFWMIDLGMQ